VNGQGHVFSEILWREFHDDKGCSMYVPTLEYTGIVIAFYLIKSYICKVMIIHSGGRLIGCGQ
jgi:hypothetical protein